MGNVTDDFWEFFKLRSRSVVADEDTEQDDQQRRAEVRDMRVFVETSAYSTLRQLLREEIESMIPDPRQNLGNDAAAATAYMQAGLRRAEQILDTMIQVAAEKVDEDGV